MENTENFVFKESGITLTDKILAATVLKLFPQKITPNQITIFRLFMAPVATFFIYAEIYSVAIPLFIITAFSDALDGALARTRNKVTEWGKIYDPFADKLFIGLAAVVIIPRYLNSWLAFSIIFIEMLLIGLAYYLKNKGKLKITANRWGKIKMFLQSAGIILLLIGAAANFPIAIFCAQYFIYAALIFAIISLITYGI